VVEVEEVVHRSPFEVHDWECGLTSIPEFRLASQPWVINPYKPISWLEMLQFSAGMFFWCGRSLREIRVDCLVASIPGSGDEPIFTSTIQTHRYLRHMPAMLSGWRQRYKDLLMLPPDDEA
jgi:hypothetical protein